MTRFTAHKSFVSVFVAVVLITVIGYTTYAAVINPKSGQKTPPKPDQKALLADSLTKRISQYEAFASTSLEAFSSDDRRAFSADLQESIARMKLALESVRGSTTTDMKSIRLDRYLTKEDTVLASKMAILQASFKPTSEEVKRSNEARRKDRASTSPALLSGAISTTTASTSPRIAAQSVFSKKTSISNAFMHKLVIATSSEEVQKIKADIEGRTFVKRGERKKVMIEKAVVVDQPTLDISTSSVVSTSTEDIEQGTSTPEIN